MLQWTLKTRGETVSTLLVAAFLIASPSPVSANPDASQHRGPTADGGGTAARAELRQSFDAPETPRAGDPLTLRLVVDHPPEARLQVDPKLESSRWRLVDRSRQTAGGEGQRGTVLELVFQVFRVGEATLDPIEVVVTSAEGDASILETSPVSVRIHSVLEDGAEPEFRPAPPPYPVWQRDYTFVRIGGAVGGFLVVAFFGFLWVRTRDDSPEITPDRPPEEVALDRLEELADSSLLEHSEFMLFYVRLSETVRRYLGRRFGFPGVEWTSREIVERLGQLTWQGDIAVDEIAEWMRRIDLVKFSGRVPDPEEARRALERAVEIVEGTAPPRPDTDGTGDEP